MENIKQTNSLTYLQKCYNFDKHALSFENIGMHVPRVFTLQTDLKIFMHTGGMID